MTRTHSQSGATLVVALIFLVMMALFAAVAFNGASTNLRVVGNMQIHQEAVAAASKAIEQTLSSTDFATKPATVAALPISVSMDGAGQTYTVNMKPTPNCYRTKVIKSSALNMALASDRNCLASSKVDQGGFDLPNAASTAGDSLCANSEWNVGASVTDPASGTVVEANQGVAVRVLTTDAANACPNTP